MQIASLAEVGVTNVSTSDTIDSTFSALQRAQLARRGSFTLEARIAQLDQLRDAVELLEWNTNAGDGERIDSDFIRRLEANLSG